MDYFWHGFEKQAKVFAYRNIRMGKEEHVYSVKEDGKVKRHTSDLILSPATFKVSDAGRDRVRAEGVKNVHAGVVGDEAKINHKRFDWRPVTYDPKKHHGFVDRETGAPVAKADAARLTRQGVLAGFAKQASLGGAMAMGALGGLVYGGATASAAAMAKNLHDLEHLKDRSKGHNAKTEFSKLKPYTKGITLKTLSDITARLDSGTATQTEEKLLGQLKSHLPLSPFLAMTNTSGFDSVRTVLSQDEAHPSILAHEVGHFLDDQKFPAMSEAEKTLIRNRSTLEMERAAWDAAPGPIDPEIRRRALSTYERAAAWPKVGLIGGATIGAILGAALHAKSRGHL
jgi:hypothetical protein